MHARLSVLTALALAACGGSTTPGNPGQSQSCSVTLSGAVTGTFDCKPATTVWSSGNNTGGFTFNVGSGAGTAAAPSISVAIGFSGEPQAKAYQSTDSGMQAGVTVNTGSTSVWYATAPSGGSSAVGSYTLTFTSVSNAVSTTSNGQTAKAYDGEGTLTGTLKSATGGADLNFSATF